MRDEASAEWRIEPAELYRLYPGLDAQGAQPMRNGAAQGEIRELQARLADKDAVIEDLRRRLDEERTDRRQTADRLAVAQERITALLTDQRTASRVVPSVVLDSAPLTSPAASAPPMVEVRRRIRLRLRHWLILGGTVLCILAAAVVVLMMPP